MKTDPDAPPRGEGDLVDRGPVETLAPSRTALVLVGIAALTIAVLAGLGTLNVSNRVLDEGEQLLQAGTHTLRVGPAALAAELSGGDWIHRQRCERWVQLNDASDDASTLHVVWLDAVPLPSDAPEVRMVDTPDDLPSWWRDELDLDVVPLGEATLDGRTVARYRLEETPRSRRLDGLVACGEAGGPAGVGMLGPAARFDQQVAIVDVDGTPLLLIAAAYVGGDPGYLDQALEDLVVTGELSVEAASS